ncbi:hypothetical protein [Salinarchaeum chitinilyticum]
MPLPHISLIVQARIVPQVAVIGGVHGLVESPVFWGLFIPATVTVGGSFLLYRRKQNRERERLRKAFLAELYAMDSLKPEPVEDVVYSFNQLQSAMIPQGEMMPSQVYSQNLHQLGKLHPDEVQSLIRLYTLLDKYKRDTKMFEENPHVALRRYRAHIEHLIRMGEFRLQAIREIESRLDTEYNPEDMHTEIDWSTQEVE